MGTDVTASCQSCGASIYKQHLDSGIARYVDGKLMCAHCVNEQEQSPTAGKDEFEPIELDGGDDEVRVDMSQSRIHSASAATLGVGKAWDESSFQRPIDANAPTATRCRTFHSKLSDAALSFMNNQINDWLDSNKQISIKFATSTIGIFEGKHAEPNLILTLFY